MPAALPVETGSIDAALWRDLGPLDRIPVEAARALVRLVAVLRPPGDPRFAPFLRLYDRLADAPPAHFTKLWRTPGWGSWALVAARLAQTPESPELLAHLAQFGGLAVGLGLLTGEDVALETPWVARLPALVPGMDWDIEGESTISIDGVRHGAILAEPAGAVLRRTRRATHGEVSIAVSRGIGNLPWVDWPDGALARAAQPDFYDGMQAHLERALGLVALHASDAFEGLAGRLVATGYADPARGPSYSSSNSSLTGMMMLSGIRSPWELADSIIHEFHHNRLFAVESERPMLRRDGGDRCYSPWRDEPRPIRGVQHAVYVYCATAAYWLDVHRGGPGDAALSAYAADQSARAVGQLLLGIRVLERKASWTEFGAEAFAAMVAKVAALRHTARRQGLGLSIPAWICRADGEMRPARPRGGRAVTVLDDLRDHAAKFDIDGDVLDLIDSPDWSI